MAAGATLASYGIVGRSLVRRDALRLVARARIPDRTPRFPARAADFVALRRSLSSATPVSAPAPRSTNSARKTSLWIRDPFLYSTADHGALIVHGHTPVDTVTHYGNRLAIDTGAGYGRALSAVVIEGRQAWHLTEDGRVPVDPI